MCPIQKPTEQDRPTLPEEPAVLGVWRGEKADVAVSGQPLRSWAGVEIPRRLTKAGRLAMWLFALLAVAVAFIPWTQTITASGRLSAYSPFARPQDIHAQIAGRIKRWHVHEGERVQKGDLIVELEDVDPSFMAPELLDLLRQSKDAIAQTRQAALERAEQLAQRIGEMEKLLGAAVPSAEARVLEAENKIRAAEQQIIAARIAFQTDQLDVDRHRELAEQGLVSQRELEVATQAWIASRAELEAAEAVLEQAKQAKRALSFGRDQVNAEMAQRLLDTRAALAAALGEAARAADELATVELKLSNAAQRRHASRVAAPTDGTVVRMAQVGAGELVKPGDRLVRISPLSEDQAAELWAKGLDAPLLTEGRKVRLLFEGMPAVPLPSWPELMAGTFGGEVKVIDQVDDGRGNFRFWVVPDPEDRPWPDQSHVRQGTQVMAWVILNRVPLWYELWRRFNLFPPDYHQDKPRLLDTVLPKGGRSEK